MKIGFTEIVLIFIVALVVIGPDKLPYYAKKLGAGLREFRKATDDMTKDIRESVVEPLEEAQKPIREAMEPFEQLDRDVRNNFRKRQRNGLMRSRRPAQRMRERKTGPRMRERKAGPRMRERKTGPHMSMRTNPRGKRLNCRRIYLQTNIDPIDKGI